VTQSEEQPQIPELRAEGEKEDESDEDEFVQNSNDGVWHGAAGRNSRTNTMADDWNRKTKITFSGPVEIPGSTSWLGCIAPAPIRSRSSIL